MAAVDIPLGGGEIGFWYSTSGPLQFSIVCNVEHK
jgi:hypothetical protein